MKAFILCMLAIALAIVPGSREDDSEIVPITGTDMYLFLDFVCLMCGRDELFQSHCSQDYGLSLCSRCPAGEYNPYNFHVNKTCIKKKYQKKTKVNTNKLKEYLDYKPELVVLILRNFYVETSKHYTSNVSGLTTRNFKFWISIEFILLVFLNFLF